MPPSKMGKPQIAGQPPRPSLAIACGCLALLMLATGFAAGAAPVLPAQDLPAGTVSEDYRLGPGDELEIEVYNQDDLTGRYSLDGSGKFSMNLIGVVDARGLTAAELESKLVDRLRPDYLVNPRVSVRVLKYRPFYIIGEVNSPNSYPYVDGMTYLTAIAIAGGYTYRAKKDVVYVVRGNDPSGEELKLSVNDKVMPGDIIRVDERMF